MKTHPARQLGMCCHAKFNATEKGLVKPEASMRWYEITGCFNISCFSAVGNAILGLFRAATLLCLFFLIWLLCLRRNLGQSCLETTNKSRSTVIMSIAIAFEDFDDFWRMTLQDDPRSPPFFLSDPAPSALPRRVSVVSPEQDGRAKDR